MQVIVNEVRIVAVKPKLPNMKDALYSYLLSEKATIGNFVPLDKIYKHLYANYGDGFKETSMKVFEACVRNFLQERGCVCGAIVNGQVTGSRTCARALKMAHQESIIYISTGSKGRSKSKGWALFAHVDSTKK